MVIFDNYATCNWQAISFLCIPLLMKYKKVIPTKSTEILLYFNCIGDNECDRVITSNTYNNIIILIKPIYRIMNHYCCIFDAYNFLSKKWLQIIIIHPFSKINLWLHLNPFSWKASLILVHTFLCQVEAL